MTFDSHERARTLLDRSLMEEIAPREQAWLDRHLASCSDCSAYVELSQRAIHALGAFAFDIDPAAALRVESVVQERLRHPEPVHVSGRWLALFLTAAGSLAMWLVAGEAARYWNLPDRNWQLAFTVFWLLPSVVLNVFLLLWSRQNKEKLYE